MGINDFAFSGYGDDDKRKQINSDLSGTRVMIPVNCGQTRFLDTFLRAVLPL